ncbi:hypothetical protein [Streptomyces prasinus]|uniref:hypothetical protein n=1 Tax=Streptomyces prasinus TaxID=67345 RepID=UPI0036CE771A
MTAPEAFRTTACELGVSDDSGTRILQYLHPAYSLSPADADEGTVGWLGGLPNLPSDVTWDGSGVFVASIDLAALPGPPLAWPV